MHEPTSRAFGVACLRTEPFRLGEGGVSTASFKLLDDTSFSGALSSRHDKFERGLTFSFSLCVVLSQFNCDPDEVITAVTTIHITIDGKSQLFFCVGTFISHDGEKEPTKGRLLVLSTQTPSVQTKESALELRLDAAVDLPGCVYAFTIVDSKIVAAVNSSVSLISHLPFPFEGTPC